MLMMSNVDTDRLINKKVAHNVVITFLTVNRVSNKYYTYNSS